MSKIPRNPVARGEHRALCPAPFCGERIPKRDFFCIPHWKDIPPRVRKALWRERALGQEYMTHPTFAYQQAMDDAIEHLKREGKL